MALSTTGLVLAASLVGGAVGVGATVLVLPAAQAPPPSAAAPDPRVPALEERLAKAETEVRRLSDEVTELRAARAAVVEARPAPVAPARPAGEAAAFPSDSAALANASPEEKARIEAVIKEMQAKAAEERVKRQKEQQTLLVRSMIDRRAATAGLTVEQKDQVVRIVGDFFDKRRDLRSQMTPGGGEDALRRVQEDVGRARDEAKQALTGLLTADQLKAVEPVLDRSSDGGANPGTGRFDGRRRGQPGGTGTPPQPTQGGATQPPR